MEDGLRYFHEIGHVQVYGHTAQAMNAQLHQRDHPRGFADRKANQPEQHKDSIHAEAGQQDLDQPPPGRLVCCPVAVVQLGQVQIDNCQ